VCRVGWGEWDSVSCYTCGLSSINPERDQPVRETDEMNKYLK
jgi:hypothetical protein